MNEDQKADLEAACSAQPSLTRRPTCPQLEEDLFKVFPALDHGFVRLIDYMGDEAAITQAARVSYGKGTKTVNEDIGLIRYLIRHAHTTPLEMCEIKFHMRMPIFVARQFIRHRTANVNEYSGRYSILSSEFYVPEPGVLAEQSKTNKQGRDGRLTRDQQQKVLDLLIRQGTSQYSTYQELLNDDGEGNPVDPEEPMLARELARMGLGLHFYTEWYWKIDLHNLLHFLSLRVHSHAQYEIRVFAEIMNDMVTAWVPNVAEAFDDYHPRRNAHTFSAQEMELVRHLASMVFDQENDWAAARRGLADQFELGTVRERKAFWQALGVLDG